MKEHISNMVFHKKLKGHKFIVGSRHTFAAIEKSRLKSAS